MSAEALSKFCIIAYRDPECVGETGRMELDNKPSKISIDGKISYVNSSPIGIPVKNFQYSYSQPRFLNFELLFDGTGAVNGIKDPVKERCDTLYELAYKYNEEIHSPSYLRILWGTFDFKGRLTDLSIDYTMFDKTGRIVRALVACSILEVLD